MVRRVWPYLELGDLVAIGAEALLRAAADFDPGRGASFASFAYLRVRGAMLDGVGSVGQLPRGLVRKRPGRPERAALPVFLDLDDHRVMSAAGRDLSEELVSAIDMLRSAGRLGPALASLGERERHLIVRHYFDGDSLHEIGLAMDRSRSWASRAHTRALVRLRAALEAPPGAAVTRSEKLVLVGVRRRGDA